MKTKPARVVMIGIFPPPVHGLAMVTAAVREVLIKAGSPPLAINIAATSLDRSIAKRLTRIPRVVRGWFQYAGTPGREKQALYMSVSGGFGQVYEIVFLLIARLRRARVFLHHNSTAYLTRQQFTTQLLVKAAGPEAVHITQSAGLAARIRARYGAENVVHVSNVLFLMQAGKDPRSRPRRELKTLGFLSNISGEKGVFEFLDLMSALQKRGLALEGKLAGPFQDEQVEGRVRERLSELPHVHYLGPVYGPEKQAFYADLDAFVFPTNYVNEAEPLVLHEAMSAALPVIAYGRGAIPEILPDSAGLVIDPEQPFLPHALAQVEAWCADPISFHERSVSARDAFNRTRDQSLARWNDLLAEMLGGGGD